MWEKNAKEFARPRQLSKNKRQIKVHGAEVSWGYTHPQGKR